MITDEALQAMWDRWSNVTGESWEHRRGSGIWTAEKIDIDGEGDREIRIPYDDFDSCAIAHARVDVPMLIKEVQRLRSENAKLHNDLVESKLETEDSNVLNKLILKTIIDERMKGEIKKKMFDAGFPTDGEIIWGKEG